MVLFATFITMCFLMNCYCNGNSYSTTIITLPPSPPLVLCKPLPISPPPPFKLPPPPPFRLPPSPIKSPPSPIKSPPSPIRFPPSPIRFPPSPIDGNDWLTTINTYRLIHRAPPVQWSATLAQLEQAHTDACVFAHSNDQYGENLGMGYTSVNDVVNAWYSEAVNYDYLNPGFGMNTGHFTQVVWVNTKYIGCSQTKCPQGVFYGCKFDPPGNVYGQFPANVLSAIV